MKSLKLIGANSELQVTENIAVKLAFFSHKCPTDYYFV